MSVKGLAGLGATAIIAGAALLWFMTKPAVVVVVAKPLTPNAALSTFRPIASDYQFGSVQRQSK